jgi:hypothetical protein
MKPKNYLILFLIFFGELLIVLGFLHFSLLTPGRIVALNIVVSSIIFLSYMINFLQPRYNFNDRSQKTFAGLGIRAYALLLYSIAAIVLMINMNGIPPQSFITQLIVHAGLLFLFGLGIFFSMSSVDKTESVYNEQSGQRAPIETMRRVGTSIFEKSLRTSLPQQTKDRIAQIPGDLRYIAPANTADAAHLEDLLLNELQQLDLMLSMPVPDDTKVNDTLLNFESLYRQRKQVYSY